MFPNLRLMIVAVVASILGISCALGLFAEFRVSHDSFLRESKADAQLGVGDTARVVNTAATSFEFRFQASPLAGSFETAGGSEASDQATIVGTAQPARPAETTATPAPEASAPRTLDVSSATQPADVPGRSDGATDTRSPAATGPIANQTTQQDLPQNRREDAKPEAEGHLAARTPMVSPSVGTAEPPSPISSGAVTEQNSEQESQQGIRHNTKPEAGGDVAVRTPTNPPLAGTTEALGPAATSAIADQDNQQKIPTDSRQSTKTDGKGDLADRTPASSPAVGTTRPKPKTAPAHARTARPEKRRRTTVRRKRPIVRRVQRTLSDVPTQDFTGVQPSFQWTAQPASQSPQPGRRSIIKRVRPVRKPVAQRRVRRR